MRITIVMGFFLPVPALRGGAMEKIWSRLAERLAEAGHEVTLVSRQWPGFPRHEASGHLRHLRLRGAGHTRWLPLNLILDFLWGLQVLVAAPPADILVCNTVSLPVFARRLRPSAGRVVVVLGRMPKGQARLYGAASLVLATSGAVAARVRRENRRLTSRLVTLPNSIDWGRHHAATSPRPEGTPLTIGYAGRIHPEKGLERLLEAAVLLAGRDGLPPWKLMIVGPVSVPEGGGGEAYLSQLRSRFEARLGARLELHPPVYDPDALAGIFGSFDVFCYPSIAAQGEGLSVAPIEAMAAGAVPVVSRLECYRDVIEPGVNGLDFDHAAPDATGQLATALGRLLSDAPFRRRLAEAAGETARRYDYDAVLPALLEHFERLLASTP